MDSLLYNTWMVTPVVVEERRFVDIYTSDYKCKKNLDCNFSMVRYLKKQRDVKTTEAMKLLAHEEDLNDEENNTKPVEAPLHRPKRELIDRIPKTIEISVVTRNGVEATVVVLPSWREKGVLQIELTEENIDLLLEEPPAESSPFVPEIIEPDVVWVCTRNHVRCTFWDSKKKAFRIKSKHIEFDPDMEDAEIQEIVNREAEAMQSFYNQHHNQLRNMQVEEEADEAPQVKRPRGEPVCETSGG